MVRLIAIPFELKVKFGSWRASVRRLNGEGGLMNFDNSYSSWEEFQREELRRSEHLGVGVGELLSEFDNEGKALKRKAAREGLFDAYGDDEEESYDY